MSEPSRRDMIDFEYRYLEGRYAALLTPERKKAIRTAFEQQNAHMRGGLGDALCYVRLVQWAILEMPDLPAPKYVHADEAGELLLEVAA